MLDKRLNPLTGYLEIQNIEPSSELIRQLRSDIAFYNSLIEKTIMECEHNFTKIGEQYSDCVSGYHYSYSIFKCTKCGKTREEEEKK